MRPDDSELPDTNFLAELDDPDLALLAGAILDGTPVDWTAAAASIGSRHAATLQRLRVLADVAALHRSLTPPGAVDSAAQTSPAPQWGPLTLRERIGAGAFGEVFRAWDNRLDREVALKLLRPISGQAAARATEAIEEGRLLARVRHPNVVTVYGAERIDGRVGMWTEFIRGRTLAEFVAQHGRLSAQEATAVGIDLCRALSAVHKASLVHRDIKPQNVMREEGGRTVLMDFGAGRERVEETIGGEGDLAGTPLYLAPELWRGAEANPRSDIYSLGVLLYFLVTQTHPVRGRTMQDVRDAHAAGRHVLLRDERPDLPDTFIDVVERSLARDPAERYESAGAFEAGLKHAQSSIEPVVSAATVSASAPTWRGGARRAILLLAAAGVVAAAGAAVFDVGHIRTRWSGGGGASNSLPVGIAASTSQRRLSVPYELIEVLGHPSRDGRYFPYANGDLFFWERATGATHQVTTRPADSAESAGRSAMSPDGSSIAYMWWTLDGAYDLRVISADGSRPRSILKRQAGEVPVPIEWSADGTNVLCRLEESDGRVSLALVPTDGSSMPNVLHTFVRGQPRQVSLSPDGRFVVYDFPRDFRSFQSQLFIVGTDGSPPRALFDEPANDLNPFWMPDGQHVFFASDRSGSIEGWNIEVVEGVAQGEPSVVAKNLGLVLPVALTSDGTYYYFVDTTTFEVYTLPVDLANAKSSGKPVRVPAPFVGGHVAPSWSADGRLAYVTRVPSRSTSLTQGSNLLTILDADGVTRRDVRPQLSELAIDPPRWSPDNRHVVVKGIGPENLLGYFQVDVDTGDTTPVVLLPPQNQSDASRAYQYSTDGRALLYFDRSRGIVSRDLATGTEAMAVDLVTNKFRRFFGFAISPQGSLAFAAMGPNTGDRRAVFVQIAGVPTREVFRSPDPAMLLFVQAWTPDGQDILVTRFGGDQDAEKDPHALWAIAAASGVPRDTNVRIPAFTNFYRPALSADGRRLAYTVGMTAAELWAMDKFLPQVPSTLKSTAR